MRFKMFVESEAFEVPFTKIHGWQPKLMEAVADIQQGRLSHTEGPVTLSRLDDPRGHFFVINGYHRILEALVAGQKGIAATIDPNIPRIERTGGAFRDIMQNKVPILSVLEMLK